MKTEHPIRPDGVGWRRRRSRSTGRDPGRCAPRGRLAGRYCKNALARDGHDMGFDESNFWGTSLGLGSGLTFTGRGGGLAGGRSWARGKPLAYS